MGIETGTKISDLNAAWPLGTDPKSEGDNHLRLIKAILQNDAAPLNDPAVFKGSVRINNVLTVANGAGSVRLVNDAIAANLGHWSIDVTAGGVLQITPRDANDDVIPTTGGGFQISRNAAGLFDVMIAAPNMNVTPQTNGSVITRVRGDNRYTLASSSRRFKDQIHEVSVTPESFDQLRPVAWVWGGELPEDDPRRGSIGFGLIAEEVAEEFPAAVVENPDGEIEGLQPLALIGVLVAVLQDVRARMAAAGI